MEEVADFEVEVWEVGGAAEPVMVGVYVGKGDDLSASLLDGWGEEGFRVAFLLCPSANLSLKTAFFEDKYQ